MIVAATGHRPGSLGVPNPWSHRVFQAMEDTALKALKHTKATYVISGMALGWDQAIVHAAIDLGIPFAAYVPFKGQELRWPATSRAHYRGLCDRADSYRVVSSGGYTPMAMTKRNRAMVDDAEVLITLWNGGPSGTGHCISYAREEGLRIVHCWKAFLHTLNQSEVSE